MKRRMRVAILGLMAVGMFSIASPNEAQAKKTVVSSEVICEDGEAVQVNTVERSFLGWTYSTKEEKVILGPSSGC